ncbi:DUF397 domain-containing protein [Streptomyces avermitilis]|uniref:DUF397 domain-containing protein n=1 Tax=Streptomyces avermitilis TaxID=33903 RepID=UPI0033FBA359
MTISPSRSGENAFSEPHRVHVRDSKDTDRPGPAVGADAWAMFVGYAVDQTT